MLPEFTAQRLVHFVCAGEKAVWICAEAWMFGWGRTKKAVSPVDEETRQWIDQRWDWLEEQFGLNQLRETRVILPRAEFFPDPYHGGEDDVRRMLDRVCGYMNLVPQTIEMSLFQESRPNPEGWHHGASGVYHQEGDKFRVWIEISNLDDPLALVGTMAHELGHVHLLGHKRLSEEAEDHEPLTDLLTVFFGMGIFSANSVIREHYWTSGPISGWSIGRRGYLGMPEFGYAFARFARARGEDGSRWAKELRLDVRTAFKQAMRFLDQQAQPTD